MLASVWPAARLAGGPLAAGILGMLRMLSVSLPPPAAVRADTHQQQMQTYKHKHHVPLVMKAHTLP